MNCAAPNMWNDGNTPPTCDAPPPPPPPPTCTGLEVLVGGQCFCQAPNVRNNGVCEAPPPTCTGLEVLVGGQCLCQAPNVRNNGVCEAPPPPPPPLPGAIIALPPTARWGAGVRIGIQDTGVWAAHPDFLGENGVSRISTAGANFGYRTSDTPDLGDGAFQPLNGTLSILENSETRAVVNAFRLLPDSLSCTNPNSTLQGCALAINRSIFTALFDAGITNARDFTGSLHVREVMGGSVRDYRLPRLDELEHGTAVASIAAGAHIGFAKNATIIPYFIDTGEDEDPGGTLERDPDYNRFDIINRSYGVELEEAETVRRNWAIGRSGDNPNNWSADYRRRAQIGRAEANKTVIVWSASNDQHTSPGPEAELPFFHPELRDHWAAVAAVDRRTPFINNEFVLEPLIGIASYSNHCGPLPMDWDAAQHGRHYCISAPAPVAYAARPGPGLNGTVHRGGFFGTSSAAPHVSGAIAAVMSNARGTVSAVEALRRLKRTAFRGDLSGRMDLPAAQRVDYSQLHIYGAGVLDLQAALNTFGNAQMGTATGLQAPVAISTLALPGAHGAAVARGLKGIEIAAFDSLNYPFWFAAADFVHSQTQNVLPLYARLNSAPNEQNDLLQHLQWNGAKQKGPVNYLQARMTLAQDTLGFSLAPFGDSMNKDLLRGLRFGMLFEGKTHQGARPAGAFGAGVSSQMLFVSGEQNFALGGGEKSPWQLQTRLLFGAGKPDYQRGAMFQAGASVYSSGALALQHRRGDVLTQLGVAQPLRAESGRGTLHYAGGRALSGARLYERREFSLAPKPRALRVTLRHERPVNLARWFGPFGEGLFALELLHAHNRGHIRGAQETRLDAALNLHW